MVALLRNARSVLPFNVALAELLLVGIGQATDCADGRVRTLSEAKEAADAAKRAARPQVVDLSADENPMVAGGSATVVAAMASQSGRGKKQRQALNINLDSLVCYGEAAMEYISTVSVQACGLGAVQCSVRLDCA